MLQTRFAKTPLPKTYLTQDKEVLTEMTMLCLRFTGMTHQIPICKDQLMKDKVAQPSSDVCRHQSPFHSKPLHFLLLLT